MNNSFNEEVRKLSSKIKNSNVIKKNLPKWEHEADVIAIALLEIKQSFEKIYKDYIYRFDNENKPDDILLDIGEEFRHVLYHIKDMNYFSYLFDENISDNSIK
jgi:hypothetical protein